MSLEELRRQYVLHGLSEADLPADPFEVFHEWFEQALAEAPADWVEPYAMTLATSNASGEVSARIVLLRGSAAESGFVFYTNYDSDKGRALAENPQASLMFYWGYLERQVRVQGRVQKTTREMSETYFHKRPRGSQISAAISPQSSVVSSRGQLEELATQLEAELDGADVPLPEHWGGYQLMPDKIEFWQGRENRLHDRLVYLRGDDSAWKISRLSP